MLCLHDSIRDDDPSVQYLLRAVEDAPSLTALILATWQVARVLAVHLVEAVLAERARQPTAWPPCPACGAALRSKGLAPRQMMSLFGPIRWRRRVGRCPHGCDIPQVAPWECIRISTPAVNSKPWAVPWPFLCRLPRQRGCWAGTVAVWSARARCGVGCKRLATRPWSTSRLT